MRWQCARECENAGDGGVFAAIGPVKRSFWGMVFIHTPHPQNGPLTPTRGFISDGKNLLPVRASTNRGSKWRLVRERERVFLLFCLFQIARCCVWCEKVWACAWFFVRQSVCVCVCELSKNHSWWFSWENILLLYGYNPAKCLAGASRTNYGIDAWTKFRLVCTALEHVGSKYSAYRKMQTTSRPDVQSF